MVVKTVPTIQQLQEQLQEQQQTRQWEEAHQQNLKGIQLQEVRKLLNGWRHLHPLVNIAHTRRKLPK